MAVAQEILNQPHPFADGQTKRMLIDGKSVEAISGGLIESRNPATGELLAFVPAGGSADVDIAVASARKAFEVGPWGRMKPFDRQEILLRFADLLDAHFEDIARLDTLEMGAPISRTMRNRRRAVGMVRFYAGLATTIRGATIESSLPGEYISHTVKEPLGVVGAIIPWNNPHGATIWKILPALAAGCTVVLKPSEDASLSPLWIGELLLEAGLPAGVLNVVTGLGEQAGAALAAHGDVDKVAFTGSTLTGQEIVRASAGNLKRLSLELGGKSPDIVFSDADLDEAVAGTAMGAFNNSGQVCSAGTRLFVERPVYEEFVGRVAEFGKGLRVGNGLDPETQIGPLVSEAQLDRVTGYLAIGQAEGAHLLSGGSRLTEGKYADGYFVPPTVFSHVGDEMRIAKEEIFGPVLSAIPFDDPEDLMRRSNDTVFGLGSGIWTRDISKAHRYAKMLRAGTVWINCYSAMDPAVPFGGYKMSGYGREGGVDHLDEFLDVKSVWIKI